MIEGNKRTLILKSPQTQETIRVIFFRVSRQEKADEELHRGSEFWGGFFWNWLFIEASENECLKNKKGK